MADDIAVSVSQMTAGFPREELYGLTSQMRRAAGSVLPTSWRVAPVTVRQVSPGHNINIAKPDPLK